MNNILNKFNKKFIAFSLIELMIALAILAIITTIAITQYNIYIKKVALATATSLTDNIKARVMSYYADQEQFPSVANGNATEINNTFNVKALDANSKQYIINVQLYSKIDTSNFPALPISISSLISNPNSILGYVQINFNPAKKLSLDPAYPAQLFLVAFEISNSTAYLNNYDASQISSKPQLVLVSDATLGSQIAWQLYQSNININFPGATQSCPGDQIMIGGNCAACNGYLTMSGTTFTCNSCPVHATCSSSAITGCQTGYYGANCNSSISACNGIISGTGVSAVCNSCPTNATCSGGAITGCQSNYYGANCANLCSGTLTGSGVSATCTSCPTHAICSGGSITGCQTGYYGTNCASSCSGYLTGSGTSATCNSCPTHAICSGGSITGCQTGYYGNNCSSSISACNGIISGTGTSATCASCPPNAICSGGKITGCKSGYYGTNCGSAVSSCSGYVTGSGTTAVCNPCFPGCNACTNNDPFQCTQCEDGYSLYSFGYVQELGGKTGTVCTSQSCDFSSNCFICSTSGKCFNCIIGDALQPDGSCAAIQCTVTGCEICDPANKCFICYYGWRLQSNGTCVR